MTINAYPISDEWRAAGLIFQDLFLNEDLTHWNGGTLVGGPVIRNGARLNGTSQLVYYENPNIYAADGFTIELKFVPEFEFGDSLAHYIFDGTPTFQLTATKHSDNTLYLLINGTTIFNSGGFGSYWRVNQENSMIISATSGNTTVYLNNVKVVDSDTTAFGKFLITKFALGSKEDGTFEFPGIVKSFRFFVNKFTDADCEKLYDGRLLDELDPMKAAFYAGLNDSYTNGDGAKVSPIYIYGEKHEMFFGSDGKTAGQYPTEITPRGWQLNGAAFGNAGDRDEFTFLTPGGNDKPFSAFCFYQPRSPFLFSAMVSKYTNANLGEWMLYHTNTGLVRLFQNDQSAGTAIFQTVTAPLVPGLAETWLGVSDGSGITAGQSIYRNGNLAPSTPTGAYGGMENSTVPLLLGNYGGAIVQAGTREYLVQVVGAELSSAQARVLDAMARRTINVSFLD